MSVSPDPDQQFHENLKAIGSQVDVPAGPSSDVRSRCLAAFDPSARGPNWRVLEMMRKPSVLSAFGVAAVIAITFGLLFPANHGPTVQAATIIKKLNEQIEESPLIEVTLNSLAIDELFVDGRLQVSEQAVAGELELVVQEGPTDGTVEVDLALALSEQGGWVLIRKLVVPDPQAQAVLGLIFPSGTETLLLLPEEELAGELGLDLDDGLRELRSGEVVNVLKAMIESHDELGATIQYQSDGTILLTLPIEDAEALAALEQWVEKAESATEKRTAVVIGKGDVEVQAAQIDVDADNELIGSTLRVVYDPEAEAVRSFSIDDLGSPGSSISVSIGEGEIDPASLDHNNYTTPNTRTLDLGALQSIFKQFDVD